MHDNIIAFDRSADEWMALARKAMTENDCMTGIRYYRKAMDLAGAHPFILLEMGYAYFSLYCYETVEHLILTYMESVDRFGTSELDGEWCNLLAINAINRKDENMALSALRAFNLIDPKGAHRRGADELLTTFPWKRSIPPPRAARAYTLLRHAGSDIEKVLQAVRRDPTGHSAVRAAGLLAASDPERSLRLIRTARQKGMPDWDLFDCHLTLARAYAMIGHLPEAEIAWNTAAELCERFDHVEGMVRGAIEIRQYAWAQELLDAWLESGNSAVCLLRYQILLSTAAGDTEKEHQARIRLRQLDPWHPLNTQSMEQTEQTLRQKRSMIQSRITPLSMAYVEEGDLKL